MNENVYENSCSIYYWNDKPFFVLFELSKLETQEENT